MSFQAYLDNIKAKTGKSPEDFKKLAEKKGLLTPEVKAGQIVSWLKKDFELGHGHAMAIYTVFKGLKEAKQDKVTTLDKHFAGARSKWRGVFDALLTQLKKFGIDVNVDPAISYLSILRGNKKFAIVQVTTNRMDIGLKLKGVRPGDRFEPAGNWNAMMTHRVKIENAKQIDKELMDWLNKAYIQNGNSE
ncbi:MAG TPA: DUF4287 domain-containing protein [Chitinophagaceae bacterium]|nr:DUF4287 domain-containing protein [Chitinophagaceae bacterium]